APLRVRGMTVAEQRIHRPSPDLASAEAPAAAGSSLEARLPLRRGAGFVPVRPAGGGFGGAFFAASRRPGGGSEAGCDAEAASVACWPPAMRAICSKLPCRTFHQARGSMFA